MKEAVLDPKTQMYTFPDGTRHLLKSLTTWNVY